MISIKTISEKLIILSSIVACSLSSLAHADANGLQGMKLGFGYDLGLGITGQMGNYNGFVGNDGLAIDYKFVKNSVAGSIPTHVYMAGGGYAGWDGNIGVRVPVGLEARFTPEFDAYVQVIPELNLINDVRFGLGAGLGVRYQF